MIVPTIKAKNQPRKVQLKKGGKSIGIGGSITEKHRAPKLTTVIPEATQSEYKAYHELCGEKLGLTKVATKGEEKAVNKAAKKEESNG